MRLPPLLLLLLMSCDTSSSEKDPAPDADGDGVPAAKDCDDSNPLVGDSALDHDCDGITSAEDCDDNSAEVGARALDADCDGTDVDSDCDDFDPASATRAEDADCDGILAADDCDDTDERIPAEDMDCDGLFADEDCDDTDAAVPAEDADCDGARTEDDCDDTDPAYGARVEDIDCDGVVSGADCDDADPTHGDRAFDRDCDRVLTADDCDDDDPALPTDTDRDCDGATSDVDCSDYDASLGSVEYDADCDGVLATLDCDDNDYTATATNEDDADCDGLATADDCDDHDPELPWPDDLDCDGVLTHPGGGDMERITAGTFDMGYRGTETCRSSYTSPPATSEDLHSVTITRDYFIGVTEVTQLEWEAFVSGHVRPTTCSYDDCPVTSNVALSVVFGFLNAMSTANGYTECYAADATTGVYIPITGFLDCSGYRLPTDAEWELAARCGEETEYSGSDTWSDVAVWWESSPDPVASLAANACGLYDMSGNLNEVVNDLWAENYYEGASSTDPLGAWPWDASESTPDHTIRGGDYDLYGVDTSGCQVALHLRTDDDNFFPKLGLRVARTAP